MNQGTMVLPTLEVEPQAPVNSPPPNKAQEASLFVQDGETPAAQAPTPDEIGQLYEAGIGLGIFSQPENFEFMPTLEKLHEVIQFTESTRQEQVLNNLLSAIPDPRIKDILDYALRGGKYADVYKYMTAVEQSDSWSTLNPKEPEEAEQLVNAYLTYLKTPKTTMELMLEKTKEDPGKFTALAEEARQFFHNQSELTRAEQKKQSQLAQEQADRETLNFHKEFNTALDRMKITGPARQNILDVFTTVNTSQGNMTKYEAIQAAAQLKPEHFIQLIVFMNSYDAKKGFTMLTQPATENNIKNEKVFGKWRELAAQSPKSTTEQTTTMGALGNRGSRNPADTQTEVY